MRGNRNVALQIEGKNLCFVQFTILYTGPVSILVLVTNRLCVYGLNRVMADVKNCSLCILF